MKTTYFGLQIKNKKGMEAQDFAARLFLSPRLSPEHVRHMLDMLADGRLSVDAAMRKTEDGILELKRWKTMGKDIPAIMSNKLDAWIRAFKEPSDEDYTFVENRYGFSKSELFGQEEADLTIDSAKELDDYVKQYIKGQDQAIEQLAVPFFLHLESKRNHDTCRIKDPVLLMGPTGSGKSEMLRIFGKACDCPVIRINTSEIAPSKWKGLHITDIIVRELSDKVTIKDLEYAVLVFHEFDKITHYGQTIVGNTGTDEDIDLMRDIMRLFETDHSLNLEDGFDSQKLSSRIHKLPVDNLLVVFDGAFCGIESIIKRRLNIGSTIGFTASDRSQYDGVNLQSLVTDEDLIEWGYMPELIGRIGNVVVMNPLSTDDIYLIMTTAKGSILQSHIDHCLKHNIDLHFTDDALYYIADEAHKSGLGFRNVKTILSKALNRLYFEMPGRTASGTKRVVEVSKDFVMKTLCKKQL